MPEEVAPSGLVVVRDWGVGADTPAPVAQAMQDEGMSLQKPFAPGTPIQPFAGYSGAPRTWDYQTGYNIISRPKREERIAFSTLKALIDAYDVARIVIGHRIDDVRSLDWSLEPMEGVTGDVSADLERGKAFLRYPEGGSSRMPFRTWLGKYLEDVLRYDAGCLYRRRNLGGNVVGLKVVSGTTIAPILDWYGDTPEAPAPAYVQFANGIPWKWMTTEDIIYAPFRPQPDSPYGFAPLEAVLMTANTDIRLQAHILNYFTAGTVPQALATLPADYSSATQVRDFQEYWDALMYGDLEAKRQIRWVPNGTSFAWAKETKFDRELALWLTGKTAAAYHVTLNDLGFTEDVNRATGETQVEVQFRVGTLPLVQHIEDIINMVLQEDLGLQIVFRFDTGQEKDDRLTEAQSHKIYVEMGAESPDEVRERILGLESDVQKPTPRFIMTRQGPVPLLSINSMSGTIDPDTFAPARQQPNVAATFAPVPGVLPEAGTQANDQAKEANAANQATLQQQGATAPPVAPQEIAKDMTGGVTAATGITGYDLDNLKPLVKAGVVAAGVCVKAADTGRVLMLQRALDPNDPASGTWEFPGGCLEPGESAGQAGVREWQEETGATLPPGDWSGNWTASNGVYQGWVYVIPSEADLEINLDPDDRSVVNPDDPDGDLVETLAWWDPAHLSGNPALRAELHTDVQVWGPVVAQAQLPQAEQIRKELRQWRANSRRRVAQGKSAKPFESEVLPYSIASNVWFKLQKAQTKDQVDDAFVRVVKSGPKARTPVPAGGRPGRMTSPSTHTTWY